MGFEFYEEIARANDNTECSKGTVVAVDVSPTSWWRWNFDAQDYVRGAFGGVYDTPNSPVCSTNVSKGYLREHCCQISEERARELHLALFEVLEAPGIDRRTSVRRARIGREEPPEST